MKAKRVVIVIDEDGHSVHTVPQGVVVEVRDYCYDEDSTAGITKDAGGYKYQRRLFHAPQEGGE